MSSVLSNSIVSPTEDVKLRDESLQAIKDWLAKEPHLPNTWEDAALLYFLRWAKFSLEKSKKKLDAYFTIRTALPEFFSNRNIKLPELQGIIEHLNIYVFPKLTSDGNRVIVVRTKEKPPVNVIPEDGIKFCFMVADICLIDGPANVLGNALIYDLSTFTTAHYAKLTPSLVKKFMVCIQEAYPERIKQVHILNANPHIKGLNNILKIFMKEKLRNRFYFHTSGNESLFKNVPRDILPQDFGGTAGKLQNLHDELMKQLEKYTPWFQEQENIKADESKRPGKPTNYDDLFGIDGSFRQLSVD